MGLALALPGLGPAWPWPCLALALTLALALALALTLALTLVLAKYTLVQKLSDFWQAPSFHPLGSSDNNDCFDVTAMS